MTKKALQFAVIVLICLYNALLYAEQSTACPVVVVMVDEGRSDFVVTVNGKTPSKGLLLTLSQLHKIGTAENASVLLVHEKVSLSMLTNLLNIMNKAGYVTPRILSFDRHKDRMAEIIISGEIPFSQTPSGSRGEGVTWGPGIHAPF